MISNSNMNGARSLGHHLTFKSGVIKIAGVFRQIILSKAVDILSKPNFLMDSSYSYLFIKTFVEQMAV